MQRLAVTRETYQFSGLSQRQAATVLSCFTVEQPNGQIRDELLAFPIIEARIRLWEEGVQANPALSWQDVKGFHNYRQYVRALVEALKAQAI